MVGFYGEPGSHVDFRDVIESRSYGENSFSRDVSGFGTREREYSGHTEFETPSEEVVEIFNQIMDSTKNILEEEDPVTAEARVSKMAGPMGPETKGPEENYRTDGGGYSIPGPMGGYSHDTVETMEDVEHTHPDYENGAPL